MPTIDEDLKLLQSAAGELKEFLFSDELYWPITGSGTGSARLSLGMVMLSEARLRTSPLSTAQQAEFEATEQTLNDLRARWRSNWLVKAEKEFAARLNLWNSYLVDYQQDPSTNAAAYPQQVRLRTILQLLEEDLEKVPSVDADRLLALDRLLRAHFQPDGFIWDAEWMPGFPREKFWFLYGKLKA